MTRHVRGQPFPTDGDPGAVAGLVTMLTLGTAFGLAALGVDWFWIVFPVGFGGVMPVAVGAAKRAHRRCEDRSRETRRTAGSSQRDRSDDDVDAALSRLRERYADGELDEARFEARLERLLLTESVDDARAYARAGQQESTATGRDADAVSPLASNGAGRRD